MDVYVTYLCRISLLSVCCRLALCYWVVSRWWSQSFHGLLQDRTEQGLSTVWYCFCLAISLFLWLPLLSVRQFTCLLSIYVSVKWENWRNITTYQLWKRKSHWFSLVPWLFCSYVCLSVCLPGCLAACLPACLPAWLSVCFSVCLISFWLCRSLGSSALLKTRMMAQSNLFWEWNVMLKLNREFCSQPVLNSAWPYVEEFDTGR